MCFFCGEEDQYDPVYPKKQESRVWGRFLLDDAVWNLIHILSLLSNINEHPLHFPSQRLSTYPSFSDHSCMVFYDPLILRSSQSCRLHTPVHLTQTPNHLWKLIRLDGSVGTVTFWDMVQWKRSTEHSIRKKELRLLGTRFGYPTSATTRYSSTVYIPRFSFWGR